MKPYLIWAAILFGVVPAYGQGCDIKALRTREDVRSAMNQVREDTRRDSREHGIIVTATDAQTQASDSETRIDLLVPLDAIAVFHTHPERGRNQPSHADIINLVALQAHIPGICSYVLGIPAGSLGPETWTVWEIFPDGKTRMVLFF